MSFVVNSYLFTKTIILVALNLVVGSPEIGAPNFSINGVTAGNGLTVGSPVIGAPALHQNHHLIASNLTVNSPVIGRPGVNALNTLTAVNLTVGSPVFGSPSLLIYIDFIIDNGHVTAVIGISTLVGNALTAINLTVGSPVIGVGNLSIHQLTSNSLTVGSPVIGAPALTQNYHFIATNLTVGSPVFGAPTISFPDPFFSDVVLLITAVTGSDGDTTYTERSNSAHVFSSAGAGTIVSNTHSEYGTLSIKSHNTTAWFTPDSNDWDISSANSDKFTIEYSFYQTDTASNYGIFGQVPGSGNFAYFARHNVANWELLWSIDGTSFQTVSAVGAITSANTWVKYCIEKNSSGKIRFYVNGTMVASSTPVDSSIHHSTGDFFINQSGASQDSWLDNVRLTRNQARYDTDGTYTVATGNFPII